jgi:GNAT superfamily N-acetyltransferase
MVSCISTPEHNHIPQLMRLWNEEFPAQLGYISLEDFERYLNDLIEPMHWLLEERGKVLAWALTFNREDERWFAIMVAQSNQRKGLGNRLVHALKEHEPVLNGWVIDHDRDMKANGMSYHSPLEFYLRMGFEVLPDRMENEKISAVKIRWTKNNGNN